MLSALLVLAVIAVLVYWKLYLLSPDADPFSRGPFLAGLGETSARLAWSLPGGDAVHVTAVGPDGRTIVARGGRLTGLARGTRYAWTASVGGGGGRASGAFQTAPRDLRRPVTFAVIGDYGSGSEHEYAVGRTLAAEAPAFVLTAGDNSYLVAAAALLDRNVFEPLAGVMAEARLWPTMGEHDLFLDDGRAVERALQVPETRGRYAIRYGPIQVVLLGLQADAGAIAFARRRLAQPGPRVRFVVLHRPLTPTSPLLPVLRRDRVQAVFVGHLHRYERRVLGGVLQFTVGTSGEGAGAAEFTKRSPDALVSLLDFGSLRVEVSSSSVRYAFVDERGRVLDRVAEPLR
jgi:hypothetical protein